MSAPGKSVEAPRRRPRRWLRWLGFGLLGLLLLILALAAWLLGTSSGARFALARAAAATDGRLSVERVEGRVAGTLKLGGLRWRDAAAGVDARIAELRLASALAELPARRLHLRGLGLQGVEVALHSVPRAAQPDEASTTISLQPPLDIVLDRLLLQGARIERDGEPVFALDRLQLGAAWTRRGIRLSQLRLEAPDGEVELDANWSGSGSPQDRAQVNGTFRWHAEGRDFAGSLQAAADGQRAQAVMVLDQPTTARLEAGAEQSSTLPWSLHLSVPEFSAAALLVEPPAERLALELTAGGDRAGGQAQALLGFDQHHLQLEALRYALREQGIDIEALSLKTPDAPGTLRAHGRVELSGEAPSAELQLDWSDVVLPPELVGQTLASHGQLEVSGSAEDYRAAGQFALGPPDRLANIRLRLQGSPQTVTLEQLALAQPAGGLEAHGSLRLQPRLGWQIEAEARRLDPGAFAADWPGAVDFDLSSEGELNSAGRPTGTLHVQRLAGSLRQHPLSGGGDLQLSDGGALDGQLEISAGGSRIHLVGSSTDRIDARLALAVASLGDWLPQAKGALDGSFHAAGSWPRLAISGQLNGSGFEVAGSSLAELRLDLDLKDLQAQRGALKFEANHLASSSLSLEQIRLEAGGDRAAHALRLDASGSPLAVRLALEGGARQDGRWDGTLQNLDLTVKGAPDLALQEPAALAWDGREFSSSDLCLLGGEARLCLAGKGASSGAASARYRIEHLPLSLLAGLADGELPFTVDGELEGSGELQRGADGRLEGSARIGSAAGSLSGEQDSAQPALVWKDLALDATLAPADIRATLAGNLNGDGHLAGEVSLHGSPGAEQELSGNLEVVLKSLSFVDLLTPQLAGTQGSLQLHYRLAGSSEAPSLDGALELADFATEVPAAGLKLHQGQVRLSADANGQLDLDGSIASGEGKLELGGKGTLDPDGEIEARITGENFLAADIPGARVLISPDLRVSRGASGLRVDGSLTIPSTRIDLAKLPGGGASGGTVSPDVVVVDAEPAPAAKPLPATVAVDVILGEDVKLAGFGLDGAIGGKLRIDQQPGREPTGTGNLNVRGSYRAYGQDLEIESGRILFAGTALDNPGLDIRAVRKIRGSSAYGEDTITAGLRVRGTAMLPVLTVFSDPSMEQSDALSYLITGKPLSGLKSGEGDMLGSAAQALGSAGGDLLAKSIGSRMGVDAGVSDSAALGGAAFTVGKYLSPKLYLSYGVGLFTPGEVVTLKYLFSPRWNFKAENATTGSRAGINYRIER